MNYKLLPHLAPQMCSLKKIAGAFSQLITDKQRGLLKEIDGAQPMDDCYAAILAVLGEK